MKCIFSPPAIAGVTQQQQKQQQKQGKEEERLN